MYGASEVSLLSCISKLFKYILFFRNNSYIFYLTDKKFVLNVAWARSRVVDGTLFVTDINNNMSPRHIVYAPRSVLISLYFTISVCRSIIRYMITLERSEGFDKHGIYDYTLDVYSLAFYYIFNGSQLVKMEM